MKPVPNAEQIYYKTSVNNGGAFDLNPPLKSNRKSQAQGLKYSVSGGGNVGKSGIPKRTLTFV